MTTPDKTPKEAKKESDQKDFDAKVMEQLDGIMDEVGDLDAVSPDHGDVAALYRELVALQATVTSCAPPVRKKYNSIIKLLFAHMDATPSSLLLSDSDGRP